MGASHQDPVFIDAIFDSTLFADMIALNPINKIDDYDILLIEAHQEHMEELGDTDYVNILNHPLEAPAFRDNVAQQRMRDETIG
jgi:peptidoglycan hydrolase CwlO-like protein